MTTFMQEAQSRQIHGDGEQISNFHRLQKGVKGVSANGHKVFWAQGTCLTWGQ